MKIHNFGFARDADCWYFLMEYIKGMSLERYLMKNGAALSVKQALPMFMRLADGLSLAHARGVIHRDVKPGNIMLRARMAHRCWWTSAWLRWARQGADENGPVGRLYADVRGAGALRGKSADAPQMCMRWRRRCSMR